MEWRFVQTQVGLDAIEKVALAWNVTLPEAFVECVRANNGGHPSKEIFDVDGESRILNRLLCFHEEGKPYVLRYHQLIRDRLVGRVYPIASDPFGNAICLDYRGDRENPSIVFWDHEVACEDPEAALTYVAASFAEFLDMLYTDDSGT